MLTIEFTIMVIFSTLVFVVLVTSMILIRKQVSQYNQNNSNDKLIVSNVVMTMCINTGLLLITNDFRKMSSPYTSCEQVLDWSVDAYRNMQVLVALFFFSSCFQYFLCFKMVCKAEQIKCEIQLFNDTIKNESFLTNNETENGVGTSVSISRIDRSISEIFNNKDVRDYLTLKGQNGRDMQNLVVRLFMDHDHL